MTPEYPFVLGEMETLELVARGHSLARYGDGEFAIAEGRGIITQRKSPMLAARLREILLDAGDCLVGIPNLHSPTPKIAYWTKYLRCTALLSPTMPYVSSFVSRPDNAPWLDTPAYWDRLESLWRGHDVVLVRGTPPQPQLRRPDRLTGAVSLVAEDLTSARSVREVVGPSVHAWEDYENLMEQIGTPTRALLCLGATATVMAVDLCWRGVHAIDLGHVGMFARRHRRHEPLDQKAYVWAH